LALWRRIESAIAGRGIEVSARARSPVGVTVRLGSGRSVRVLGVHALDTDAARAGVDAWGLDEQEGLVLVVRGTAPAIPRPRRSRSRRRGN
jgi:hypothetical protein